MDLNGLVSSVVGAVNPRIWVGLQRSTGVSTPSAANAFKAVPTYAASVQVLVQIQPLTWSDLEHNDGLNLNGTRSKFYVEGQVRGVVRATGQGGDLLTVPSGPYAGVWLAVLVLEGFDSAGWTAVACVLQNG
jgi:hypothetical protein